MEDARAWARGLAQDEFFHEYQRRFPGADVIPAVDEWVNGHEPVYNGIPDIPGEAYEIDGPAPALEKKSMFACRGCGKEFSIAIARAGHERQCKTLVKKEAVNG